MKKSHLKVFSILAVLFASHVASAQNDFFFNHYMFNPSYYNPAWVGSEREAFVAGHHRSQWVGYDATFDQGGAPTTQLVSLVIPMQSAFSGVAASVSNDRVGPINHLQTRFALSFRRQISIGNIAVGLMPGFNVKSVSPEYRATDPGDPLIPQAQVSQMRPNLHAGVYFQSNREYFVGISAENILQPSFDFQTNGENVIPLNYLLMGGTSIGFTRDFVLKPTLLLRSDLKSYTFDLSAIAYYQEKMWAGIAFRRSEALSLLLGYSFLEEGKLKLGYSFDYVLKNREAKQATSHEVFLRYDLPNLVLGGRKAVKTPRFTF